jgi:DNA polymerase
MDVCGVPHQFGWGGLHGAPDQPIHRKGLLLHVDVTSFYPTIMIVYDMLSRNVKDKSVYKQIYDTRVALKKAGKKAEQAPYKIILNSTYGICKDPSSSAYDPRQANNVCVNGQLLLLDLLEHLEGHCEVIQSNTDGLIIQIPDTDEAFNMVDDICYEWESRTGMKLGFDVITEIWQKDVNNYLFKFEDGKIERKGAWVKPLNNLDNDLPIINVALVQYMVNDVPVEDTIYGCDHLREFQKIVKVSSKYICGWHNHQKLQDKTFRVFASKDQNDTIIGKVKLKNGQQVVEKFANTPEHCFIWNAAVNFVDVPEKLDKKYYVDIAKARLQAFGI